MQRILVVDDDATVSDVVARYLHRAGFEAAVCGDGAQALRAAQDGPPALVVLDVMLPGLDGLEVLRRLRAEPAVAHVPVILLTALGEEADRLAGLELGADDYVTKPFSPRELVLRVQSVLRRTSAPPDRVAEVLRDHDIEVDLRAHRATRAGRDLALTLREYDLLAFLLQHPGRVFRREELLKQVWGWDYADHSTVTVHVRRLREKIEDDPRAPTRVVTVFGLGYRYEPVAVLAS